MEMRNKYKDPFQKKFGLKLGFMSAFVKATAFALQDQPVVNAVIDEQEIVYRDYIDISVAVATPKVRCDISERVLGPQVREAYDKTSSCVVSPALSARDDLGWLRGRLNGGEEFSREQTIHKSASYLT